MESVQEMKKIATHVALQDGMGGDYKILSHGSRLYFVESGWQSRLIGGDSSVARCETMLELEDAFLTRGIKVIFIPHDAIMMVEDIEKICHRHGTTKTLFREVRTKT